jgi:hypothetical protein
LDARTLDNLLGTIGGMAAVELIFGFCACCFIIWGLCDVFGVVRYPAPRSTVTTAGAGKMALGIAALWLVRLM